MALLVAAGTISILAVFCPGESTVSRFMLLAMATVFLAPIVWTAFVLIRRKLKSGRFMPSEEERLTNQRKWAIREATPRYKKSLKIFGTLGIVFWIAIAAVWIWSAIHRPEKRAWAAYWTVLALVNVFWAVPRPRKPLPSGSKAIEAP